jgi:hypothetical protein
VSYVRSFKEHLLNPVGVTSESKLQRERIEGELEFEELHVLRDIAVQQIQAARSQQLGKPTEPQIPGLVNDVQRARSPLLSNKHFSSGGFRHGGQLMRRTAVSSRLVTRG